MGKAAPQSQPTQRRQVDDPAILALVQQAGVHVGAGRLQQAEAGCQHILALVPNHPDALHMLGVIAQWVGKNQQAAELLGKAIQVAPRRSAFMYFNRAVTLEALQRVEEAMADYRQAIVLMPAMATAHAQLGRHYMVRGQLEQAVACAEQAILCQPDLFAAHFTLGMCLHRLDRFEAAADAFRKALALQPDSAEVLHHLGDMLQRQRLVSEAEACYRQSIALDPKLETTHNNLANLLLRQGRQEEALDFYRQALAIAPHQAAVFSNVLMLMQYLELWSQDEVFLEHRRFAERFEAPLKPLWRPHANDRQPQRRLKVGYVSGDFRAHAVAYFLEPVLACHDKAKVEVFCYHNYVIEDAVSARIKALADYWLPCVTLSDEVLAERIRQDGIDILVDLSGHSGLNRLLTFVRKPAPVQVTWLGYLGSTGLDAMDYRLSDAVLDPEGQSEPYYSETILRLPHWFGFRPEPDSPPVNELPALATGQLTLACLNNLAKLNLRVVSLWACILEALPGARLMLGNVSEPAVASRVQAMFAQAGVAAERLLLRPKLELNEYLALHHQIDLALDPFPFGGGVTTSHSLWMGVPVVTLAGNTTVSRQGASILSAAGLPEFIATSEDDYVNCVLALAQDLPRLNAIRQGLRRHCLPDAAGVARHLEALYATMWADYGKQ